MNDTDGWRDGVTTPVHSAECDAVFEGDALRQMVLGRRRCDVSVLRRCAEARLRHLFFYGSRFRRSRGFPALDYDLSHDWVLAQLAAAGRACAHLRTGSDRRNFSYLRNLSRSMNSPLRSMLQNSLYRSSPARPSAADILYLGQQYGYDGQLSYVRMMEFQRRRLGAAEFARQRAAAEYERRRRHAWGSRSPPASA